MFDLLQSTLITSISTLLFFHGSHSSLSHRSTLPCLSLSMVTLLSHSSSYLTLLLLTLMDLTLALSHTGPWSLFPSLTGLQSLSKTLHWSLVTLHISHYLSPVPGHSVSHSLHHSLVPGHFLHLSLVPSHWYVSHWSLVTLSITHWSLVTLSISH